MYEFSNHNVPMSKGKTYFYFVSRTIKDITMSKLIIIEEYAIITCYKYSMFTRGNVIKQKYKNYCLKMLVL